MNVTGRFLLYYANQGFLSTGNSSWANLHATFLGYIMYRWRPSRRAKRLPNSSFVLDLELHVVFSRGVIRRVLRRPSQHVHEILRNDSIRLFTISRNAIVSTVTSATKEPLRTTHTSDATHRTTKMNPGSSLHPHPRTPSGSNYNDDRTPSHSPARSHLGRRSDHHRHRSSAARHRRAQTPHRDTASQPGLQTASGIYTRC